MKRHTDEEIERAAERFADLADRLDPATTLADHLDDLHTIVVAVDAVRLDETRIRDAVNAARRNGRSWNLIADERSASPARPHANASAAAPTTWPEN